MLVTTIAKNLKPVQHSKESSLYFCLLSLPQCYCLSQAGTRRLCRDLPFNVTICTPAHHPVNNTTIATVISTRLVTNMAHTLTQEAPTHANSRKIQNLGISSRHLDQRFLLSNPDFRFVESHTAPASSGLALNRPIRSRISRKSALGTTTSAI